MKYYAAIFVSVRKVYVNGISAELQEQAFDQFIITAIYTKSLNRDQFLLTISSDLPFKLFCSILFFHLNFKVTIFQHTLTLYIFFLNFVDY